MLCIGTGKMVQDEAPDALHAGACISNRRTEMRALFKDHPEAITNTLAIGERCNLRLSLGARNIRNIRCQPAKPAKRICANFATKGLQERYGERAETDSQLRERLDLRAGRAREDGIRQLHPHRLGFHSFREGTRNSGRARAAAPPPDRWSLTFWESPTSIRSNSD